MVEYGRIILFDLSPYFRGLSSLLTSLLLCEWRKLHHLQVRRVLTFCCGGKELGNRPGVGVCSGSHGPLLQDVPMKNGDVPWIFEQAR